MQRVLKAQVEMITLWRQMHATGGIKCVTAVPMDKCVRHSNGQNLSNRSGGKMRFMIG